MNDGNDISRTLMEKFQNLLSLKGLLNVLKPEMIKIRVAILAFTMLIRQ